MRFCRSAWLLLLLAAAGCAESESAFRRPIGCERDDQCGSREACIDFTCVAVESGSLTGVHVELTPVAASPYVRTQLLDRELEVGAANVRFELPAPSTFDTVTVLDAAEQPIEARLSIFGQERIPGREVDATLRLRAGSPNPLQLLPGHYTLRVLPEDTRLFPGIVIDGWEVRAAPQPQQREFVLPAQYRTIRGEVTLRTADNVKLPGITVRARSIPSDLPSTSTVTDANGRFEIRLPQSEDTTFLLLAERAPELQPAWGYAQVISVPDETGRNVTVRIEDTSPEIQGLVRLRILGKGSQGPEPVAGAQVTLTASTSLDSRAFEITATTDGDGYAFIQTGANSQALRLLQSSYQVRIAPPSSSPFRGRVTTLALTNLGPDRPADKQLEVEPRPTVSGTVRSGFGLPVQGAAIQVEALDDRALLFTAATGADGTFVVRLDPGEYVLRVDPTLRSAGGELLPVGWARISVPEAAEHALPPITLEPGTLLQGTVSGARDGLPVPRTEVELFVTVGQRPVSLGRTISGEAGGFMLVVPRALAPSSDP